MVPHIKAAEALSRSRPLLVIYLEVVVGAESPVDFEIDGLRSLGTAATSRLCLAWRTALPAVRTY